MADGPNPSVCTGAPAHGHAVVDGYDCNPAYLSFDDNGSLTNPLLSQAILLALYLRANPAQASMRLNTLPCEVHPVILQALSTNATLGEVLQVTNYALANIVFVSHRQYLIKRWLVSTAS